MSKGPLSMVTVKGVGRWRVHLAWALALVVAAGSTVWATSMLLTPSQADADSTQNAVPTFTAEIGEIGESTSVQANVVFTRGPSAIAGNSGTITSIRIDPAVPIQSGDVLFTVDLRPVVAVTGATPAFRAIGPGVSGSDVAQLQRFLKGLGHYSGPVDGKAGGGTAAAIRVWQKTLGVAADGVVHHGDILFLPDLPVRGFVMEGLQVGSMVSPGQEVIATVRERPLVTVSADGGGARFAPGMTARFNVGGRDLVGVLAGPQRGGDGLLAYSVVEEESSASVCDAECAESFPLTGGQTGVQVELISPVRGVVVPNSAIAVLPDSSLVVRTQAGEEIPVVVVASGQGMSVVEGLDAGAVVVLFADDAP